jgi:DMSO/TMAO reductase YedYZ molybdopterin-dependent catalytic subunit
MAFITRGFGGRRQRVPGLFPPGQYPVDGFPVLTAGPTPRTPLDRWTFTAESEAGQRRTWSWDEFQRLPSETVTVDIHCVTKWSKLGTTWTGVPVDVLLEAVDSEAPYALAFCDGDYTTNLPVEDLMDGKAWVVYEYEGESLAAEHGGPARLLVPHLYFWKSAKWVRGLTLMQDDEPGFWESLGYHNYGDPWREQRYRGD